MIKLLIAADTLLEIFLKRSILREEVEELENFLESKSIDLCITQYGFNKVCEYLKNLAKDTKGYRKIIRTIKKRLKILSKNVSLDREALKQPLNNYESAIEVIYAINHQIGAIITHKPSDFFWSIASSS
jgi:hypothetical protein